MAESAPVLGNTETPPAVSIVTVCRNAVATIERTILSVIGSGRTDVQYIIVDGNSTDGTLAVIEKYRSHVHTLISEPDKGISDAFNKGIAATEAARHILVHADDVIIPNGLATLLDATTKSDAAVVCGAVRVLRNGRSVRRFVPQPARLTEKMSVPHMGALVSKAAWSAVGGYDLRRRIAMDHLFMLRILKRYGIQAFSIVDEDVAEYHMGGVSDRQVLRGFEEVRENLIEEGYGRNAATRAYLKLTVKSRIARALGRT